MKKIMSTCIHQSVPDEFEKVWGEVQWLLSPNRVGGGV